MQAKKKNKAPVVYKPYYKGDIWIGSNIKNALKLLGSYLFFTVLYVITGSSLSALGTVLRIIANVLVLVVCGGVMYTHGANNGDGEVALGEIVHTRLEEGKPVDAKDKKMSYRNLRGVVVFLVALAPILLITVPVALTAEKQVYALQSLPTWVDSYVGHDEIYAPLDYYRQADPIELLDVLKLICRLLVYPFVCMVGSENLNGLLLVDKLSPVLAALPGLGYVFGYLSGPYQRARVHGDIAHNKRKQKRKQKKQLKARMEQKEKKNELI